MLGKLKASALCAWEDFKGGEHKWCIRGALALGFVLGALVC